MSIKTLAALAAVLAATPLAAQPSISPGQTVTGTLDGGDPQMEEDGAYYDAYVIRGRPGDRLVVRMTSDDFDTYLHWGYQDEDGEWVEEDENDDASDGTDSRLVIQLDGDGEYVLRAAGFDEDEEGEYELRVSAMGQPPRPVRLRMGDVADGELTADDFEGEEGFEDHYVIRAAPGSWATIRAESDDFDTYLVFGVWRDGELDAREEDDDGAEGTDSQLLAEFDEDAEYHIVVRAFDGEGTGAYRVAVLEGDHTGEWDHEDPGEDEWESDVDVDVDVDVDIDEDFDVDMDMDAEDFEPMDEDEDADADEDEGDWVTLDTSGSDDGSGMASTLDSAVLDEPMQGVLGEDQPRDDDGAYFREFSYTARAGERLQVHASSQDFDAFVAVGTGAGDDFDPVAEDDDSGPDLDAQLNWAVRRSGTYTIRVTSAVPGQTGAFTLHLRSTR